MSRHKLVKNLDPDEELDEFDGGEDYSYDGADAEDGELSEEDQKQLAIGTIAVREVLGHDIPNISDREIQEALWHYFYDVPKSVTYLLNSRTKGEEKGKKNKKRQERVFLGEIFSQKDRLSGTCAGSFIAADFWSDMLWLNTPTQRQTIFVEPLYPRGGLLGGSPDAVPKMSKLQALAAARKKKAQEQKSGGSTEAEKSGTAPAIGDEALAKNPRIVVEAEPTRMNSRTYPVRKRKKSSPYRQNSYTVDTAGQAPIEPVEHKIQVPSFETAKPSAFAITMFGDNQPTPIQQIATAVLTFPYLSNHPSYSTDAFAGPSPDDVVLAAQSKAAVSKTSKTPPKTNGEKKADQITSGVEASRIDDTPRATSKNLDVLAEYGKTKAKNAANFVVIGHVDAGKSTLMGRLLYDLKVVDQRTIDRYRKEAEKIGKSSFALAWVLDQGTEERSRGVTIDIAMNKFETLKTSFTILDAPGHRDFIPNMIAGASQADFAVLVIDASTGSFESGLRGQTKEHALLVRSMGVQRLIIAINKLETVSWSKDRFDEISQQVSAFLTAAGFLPKNIAYIPVSGLLGDNIVRYSTEATASWYKGPTLVEELDNSEPVTRALDKPLRLTIGDIFRGGVQNPLSISGRIEAGSLQSGDALIAVPSTQKCYIKSLDVNDTLADWAVAGQNVNIHLTGIDPVHLKIGDVLCRSGSEIVCVKEMRVKVLAFEFLTPMAVEVHRGRLHAAGRIREVAALLDKGTGTVVKKRPRIVKPGTVAVLVVDLEGGVWPLEGGQRVVLRSGGETVAAGLVE